jgi:hypothetical protein
MKALLTVVTAVVFAAVINASPASATDPTSSRSNAGLGLPQTTGGSSQGATTGTPYYQWEYHYGHHTQFEGHWVLVR